MWMSHFMELRQKKDQIRRFYVDFVGVNRSLGVFPVYFLKAL